VPKLDSTPSIPTLPRSVVRLAKHADKRAKIIHVLLDCLDVLLFFCIIKKVPIPIKILPIPFPKVNFSFKKEKKIILLGWY
jgi:hypothetical protein